MVRPGPAFSVQDVHRGWAKSLKRLGCDLVDFNFDDRLDFYAQAQLERDGKLFKAFDDKSAVRMAAKGIEVAAYEFWPDVLLVVSGFFVPPEVYAVARARGHKIVTLFTESPYEDDRQVSQAAASDICLINDPTNLDAFRSVNPNTHYIPHAYDPEVHYPGPGDPDIQCDVSFVGTGYPSRVKFFEQVDWSGLKFTLAGHWTPLDPEHPLVAHVPHDLAHCLDNVDAARLYRSSRISLNVYRKEAHLPELSEGWAMGPREVELAACGTFFLREPRSEGDQLFPGLPTFTEPGEVRPLVDWWLAHDKEREAAAVTARLAVADRTFDNHAARLLNLLS